MMPTNFSLDFEVGSDNRCFFKCAAVHHGAFNGPKFIPLAWYAVCEVSLAAR